MFLVTPTLYCVTLLWLFRAVGNQWRLLRKQVRYGMRRAYGRSDGDGAHLRWDDCNYVPGGCLHMCLMTYGFLEDVAREAKKVGVASGLA